MQWFCIEQFNFKFWWWFQLTKVGEFQSLVARAPVVVVIARAFGCAGDE